MLGSGTCSLPRGQWGASEGNVALLDHPITTQTADWRRGAWGPATIRDPRVIPERHLKSEPGIREWGEGQQGSWGQLPVGLQGWYSFCPPGLPPWWHPPGWGASGGGS